MTLDDRIIEDTSLDSFYKKQLALEHFSLTFKQYLKDTNSLIPIVSRVSARTGLGNGLLTRYISHMRNRKPFLLLPYNKEETYKRLSFILDEVDPELSTQLLDYLFIANPQFRDFYTNRDR